jgi:hypothetical protein
MATTQLEIRFVAAPVTVDFPALGDYQPLISFRVCFATSRLCLTQVGPASLSAPLRESTDRRTIRTFDRSLAVDGSTLQILGHSTPPTGQWSELATFEAEPVLLVC